MSIADFEESIKTDIIVRRLQALITAGVTVSDQEVRDTYRKQSVKIKFDYAVISSDDLRKSINPSDSDLEAFFKKNAARYASAVPEQRKISLFCVHAQPVAGRRTAAYAAADSAVFHRAPVRVFSSGAGSLTPHSHLGAGRATPKQMPTAKAKAEDRSQAAPVRRKLE